jgi:hypothetical protein
MKNISKSLTMGCALLFLFNACEKNQKQETAPSLSETYEPYPPIVQVPPEKLVWPLSPLKTMELIAPKRNLPISKVVNTGDSILTAVDPLSNYYLKNTCLIDLSTSVKNEYEIADENITIKALEDFIFLKAGKTGWWSHWNYSPYVECPRPDVLFVDGNIDQSYTAWRIALSKKVTVFGFEIATNKLGVEFQTIVNFHPVESNNWQSLGSITQSVSSPSGARLFAVRSKVPFSMITVNFNHDYYYPPFGFAVANIRYKISE